LNGLIRVGLALNRYYVGFLERANLV